MTSQPFTHRLPRRTPWIVLSLLAVLAFTASGLRAETFDPPQAWLDGYLIFQNVMHNHQLLEVGLNGNGQLYAEWQEDEGTQDDYVNRWKLLPTTTTGFFALRNSLYPDQRLGLVGTEFRPIAGAGNDDSYLWQFEKSGDFYLLKNRLYPDHRLHVGHNGNGVLYTGDSGNAAQDDAYRWQVTVLIFEGDEADLKYRPSSHYMANDIVFENRRFSDRHIGVDYVFNGQPHASLGQLDDPAYRWQLQPSGQEGFYYLRNRLHPSQRLHVGHDGNGLLYAGCSDDDAFRWRLEPTDQQSFYLRNKMHSTQRIHLDASDQLTTSWGTDDERRWLMIVRPPSPENACQ